MKKQILSFTAAILAAAALGGCSNFLDINPKGRDVPETMAHYNGLFNDNGLMSFTYTRPYSDGSTGMIATTLYHIYMSDELIATEESFETAMGKMEKLAYQWAPDIFVDDAYSAEFGASFQQLYTYNLIADNVMDAADGTPEEKLRLQAEARVSRAYLYMMLSQWFAKPYNAATAATDLALPIVTEANSIATGFERATVERMWEFIITELEEACPDLPEVTKHRLRVYQPAGYMFLGRAYMLTGRFDDAVRAFSKAEAAIAKSDIAIELFDYNQMLSAWGYNPEKPYAWTSGYPYNFAATNNEVVYNKQVSISFTSQWADPTVYLKPELYDLFQPEDHRRKLFADKNPTGTIEYPYMRKLPARSLINEGADLADYYLMYAECLARTGNLTKARELLTTLREHRIEPAAAAIPASVSTQDDLVKFIVEERQREFMCTGHRWFDMRRLWNDPLFQEQKAGYTHSAGGQTFTLTEERLTLRIPPRVMDMNPNWTDNQ